MPDLHTGFAEPKRTSAELLAEFLDEVDRMPGYRPIKEAMARAVDLRPGMRVLDAGCGSGIEVTRLAAEHPEVSFVGLDRNPDLLDIARRRSAGLPNVDWVEADLETTDLPDGGFDLIRTERVLMYAARDALGRQLDRLIGLLRPGGRLALFELDYGATILPVGEQGDDVVRTLQEIMAGAMPDPWSGRRIPVELTARKMADVTAEPYSFAATEPVWRRIVHDTLREATERDPAPRPELAAWLAEHSAAAADHPLRSVFTGILTTARRPA